MTATNSECRWQSRLRLHPALQLLQIDLTSVQLRGLNQDVTIRDPDGLLVRILQRLDGDRTLAEAAEPADATGSAQAEHALAQCTRLVRAGHLVHADDGPFGDRLHDQLDFLRRVSPIRVSATGEKRYHSLGVVGDGPLADAVRALLNCDSVVRGETCDISIVCEGNDGAEALAALNNTNCAAGTTTLFCSIDGAIIRLGPLSVPGQTACRQCFTMRARMNARYMAEFDANNGRIAETALGSPSAAAVSILAGLIAVEVAKLQAGLTELTLMGDVIELNYLTSEFERSHILRVPSCPTCRWGGRQNHRSLRPELLAEIRGRGDGARFDGAFAT